MDGIKNYCLKLLADCGCEQECYRDEKPDMVEKDLLSYASNVEFPYPVSDIAKMLVEIGNAVPYPAPAEWHLSWETDHCCDGYDCVSYGDAYNQMLDTYIFWMTDDCPKTQEDWDYMIYNCGVTIYKRRDDIPDTMRTDRYDKNDTDWDDVWEEYGSLSQKDAQEIGWMLFAEMPEDMQQSFGILERM